MSTPGNSLPTRGYAATSADAPLAPFNFDRRVPGPRDVHIEIDFCGICHSDIHSAKNEWGMTTYPFVPGHEIIGRVVKAGKDVTRFAKGSASALAASSTPAGSAGAARPATRTTAKSA